MEIGVVVFAYNRSLHLKKTLEALKKNSGVNKLYIFQDGLKREEHRTEWEKTTEIIQNVDWCQVVYLRSEKNKGLKQSVLDGVNKVFQENDAVVVLEDDCVVQSNFMTFMRQSLEKYQNCEKVFSVSGHAWPLDLEDEKEDAYFCGRISSWGWGTWKDRWSKLELNYEILTQIKKDKEVSTQLAIWGNDMEDMLLGNIKGIIDSWAVFWGLTVIKQKGLCLNPYCSLVDNIGFDGSGVHCGNRERKKAKVMECEKEVFSLPDNLEVTEKVKQKFLPLFGGFAISQVNQDKPKAVVYGMGNYYKKYETLLNEQYNIVFYADQGKAGCYAGVPVGKIENVGNVECDVIIIMMANLSETIKVAKKLHDIYDISYKKIKIGQQIFEKEEKYIKGFAEDGKMCIEINGKEFFTGSYDEYANTMEVFKNRIYEYWINNEKSDVVFDIGGSIGDSAFWFLQNDNIEKIYVYEPFRNTYEAAQNNLKGYMNSERLELNQYGISNKTENKNIVYNSNMSCGQSTIADLREYAKKTYVNMGLISEAGEQTENIKVKRASEVFLPLIEKHANNNLILKMDCEGEEYNIIPDLADAGLLQKFHFIMLEWHYKGNKDLLEILIESGFSYWCNDKSKEMGLIYAYRP